MKAQSILLKREAGFSLLEFIGVLTVIAILASVLAPPLIRQIDRAIAKQEAAQLQIFAEAFRDHVRRTRSIPDETGWISATSIESETPEEDVTTNARRNVRVFLIDPLLEIGEAGGGLPYVQSKNGSVALENPRLMILSSLDPHQPIPITSGVMEDAADFENIWNTAPGETPVGWESLWKNSEDLLIQRIYLGDLFHHVILNSYSTPRGFYTIDDADSTVVSEGGKEGYFIEGSVLTLFDSDHSPEIQQVVQQPESYAFEYGSWNGRVFRGFRPEDDSVFLSNELFLRTESETHGSPSDISDALTRFFEGYAYWDESDFAPGSQAYLELQEAEAELRAALDAAPNP